MCMFVCVCVVCMRACVCVRERVRVFSRACTLDREKERGGCVCVFMYTYVDTHVCPDSAILTHTSSSHMHTGEAIYDVIDV